MFHAFTSRPRCRDVEKKIIELIVIKLNIKSYNNIGKLTNYGSSFFGNYRWAICNFHCS